MTGADRGEEDEQSPPVGDRVEDAAQQRADDRGEPADDGESPVEPDQRAAGVDVTACGLGDDDSDTAGEALHEPRRDQQLDGRADRAERGREDVRDDADEQDAAPPEPVRQRTRDQLSRGQPDQAGGDGQLRHRCRRTQLDGQGREGGEVEVHRDRTEHRQQEQQRRQQPAERGLRRSGLIGHVTSLTAGGIGGSL